MQIAKKTLELIDSTIEKDQGASFRQALQSLLPKMEDAYRGESSPYRSHLGISLIGDACARKLFYTFRWVKQSFFPAKVLRLFNRGHLEEARFIALLQIIGAQVWYETEDGGQFRVSRHNGHHGSALDAVVAGIPDLPEGVCAYGEFKTSNDKGFKKIVKEGVESAQPKHYVQMQCCMKDQGLEYGLYMVVNKNTDELHAEIIELDKAEDGVPVRYDKRAENIIFTDTPPPQIHPSPSWFECRFCDYIGICKKGAIPDINCRTCAHSTAERSGGWSCQLGQEEISTDAKYSGCPNHVFNPHLLNVEMLGGNLEENYAEVKTQKGTVLKIGPNHITSKQLQEDGSILND